jgi:hypothetical protein
MANETEALSRSVLFVLELVILHIDFWNSATYNQIVELKKQEVMMWLHVQADQ